LWIPGAGVAGENSDANQGEDVSTGFCLSERFAIFSIGLLPVPAFRLVVLCRMADQLRRGAVIRRNPSARNVQFMCQLKCPKDFN